jgi:hypothetical protein
MDKKEIAQGLIKSINDGIEKYQKIIKANHEKENRGLQKLAKSVGQDDPSTTGAGTELGSGTASVAVPNLTKEQLNKGGPLASPGGDGGFDGSNMSATDNSSSFTASEKKMGKSEFNSNCPSCGSTSLITLGTLGNTNHLFCSGCGAVGTTVRQENEAAMADGNMQGVAKTELTKDEKSRQVRGTPAAKLKANVLKQVRGTPVDDIKNPLAKKATCATRLPDGSGFFTGTVNTKNLKKEELKTKEVPMTATVTAEKVTGAKDVADVPKPTTTDGSGKITKGKSLKKGAMIDYIKSRAAAAKVNPDKVLGAHIPPALPSVKPAPSPVFNKGENAAAKPIAKSPASGQPTTAPAAATSKPIKTVSKL